MLAPSVTSTILVSSILGPIGITGDVTIQGQGATTSRISGGLTTRLFDVSGNGTDVTFESVSLFLGVANGDNNGGGAVRSTATGDTTLAFLNCSVGNNYTTGMNSDGGAVYATTGAIQLTDSYFSGNYTGNSFSEGGAIYAFNGSVSITRSTLRDNSTEGTSSEGGAVFAHSGAVTILQSTLWDNATAGVSSDGGAVSTVSGAVTVVNSTLSGNRVTGGGGFGGGAIYSSAGHVRIVNSTLAFNESHLGGAIGFEADNDGESLTIINSIVAKNSATTNPDFTAPGGTPVTLNVLNSLIGRSNGTTLDPTMGIVPDGKGNFVGGLSAGAAIDPQLGALLNNGGPTVTHALLLGSLAINSGNNTRATVDGEIGSAAARVRSARRTDRPHQRRDGRPGGGRAVHARRAADREQRGR